MKNHYYSSIITTAALLLISSFSDNVSAMSQTAAEYNRKYYGGAGVGRLNLDQGAKLEKWECKYDILLVERIQGKPKTDTGLFVPEEELPKFHIAKVLSMGSGREEENGLVAPMPHCKVNDLVICKNPWGIGPKDEETPDGKKLSYIKGVDIAAVITGELLPEKE